MLRPEVQTFAIFSKVKQTFGTQGVGYTIPLLGCWIRNLSQGSRELADSAT